ncbi:hypothetical protein EOD41_03430 [Mucilaginibacter limnophilus]|uniref:Protochlamydia outer membrane protein domain-containing protein n=1 Tax=Mucilaginibacter limnophilus TaxID=1932778 RepID=A0A3S2Y645_9SPHI|nr:hypothetical protein [Mucilaginibacter limnophilus]RVU02999.1 hypothetical protein EOD41_03430 [Mucilaginibacter limnophilus]
MRGSILTVALAVNCLIALAQDKGALSIAIGPNHGNDNLTWSIAGTLEGTDPNIYSELKWTKVKSIGFNANATYQLTKRFKLKVALLKAYIVAGRVSDYDYQLDNRQYVSFEGLFDADKGSVTDVSAAAGYQFIKKENWQFNLYAGYGINREHLFLRDNNGKYDARLNSTYNTRWHGPLAMAEAVINISMKLSAIPSIIYHQISYSANGNWNMIDDFEHPVSYRHTAKGFGIMPALQIGYQLNNQFQFYVNGGYHYYETGKGIDKLYLNNGQRPETQLNGITLKAYMVEAGVKLTFVTK